MLSTLIRTHSPISKEKERGRECENPTQFYLDDTGNALGKCRKDGIQKGKYIELKNGVGGGLEQKKRNRKRKCINISTAK